MMTRVLRCRAAVGVAVCLSFGLAGCDSNPGLDLSKLLSAPVAANPAGPAASAPATVSPQAAAAPDAQAAAVPPVPNLARFQDMRQADVEALVGNPDFRRVEPPAELWQYRTAECVVDLFFYGQGDDRRVVHEDARGRDPAHADRRCGDGSEVFKGRVRG